MNWYGQPVKDPEEPGSHTLASGFTTPLPEGQEHSFPLYVMVLSDMFDDVYVRLGIVPYLDRPQDGYAARLGDLVTQINHDLPALKLAINPDGDLELLLDIPAADTNEARFDAAIQSLADYAGLYYSELANAATGES